MKPLPAIMVAPNGARPGKLGHPEIPITIQEIVNTAIACKIAGCDGMHAHVRDASGIHTLDTGLYRELLRECAIALPGFYVQITTESNGVYSADAQVNLVREIVPEFVSVAFRELKRLEDDRKLIEFYRWANESGVQVQHILYDALELEALLGQSKQFYPDEGLVQILFVLGRYAENQASEPKMLTPFMNVLEAHQRRAHVDWAACAFGARETDCLIHAYRAGGKIRVGFENNILNRDGKPARDNAERVSEIVAALN